MQHKGARPICYPQAHTIRTYTQAHLHRKRDREKEFICPWNDLERERREKKKSLQRSESRECLCSQIRSFCFARNQPPRKMASLKFQTWGRGGSHLFPAIPSCSVPMVAREEVLVSSVGGLPIRCLQQGLHVKVICHDTSNKRVF